MALACRRSRRAARLSLQTGTATGARSDGARLPPQEAAPAREFDPTCRRRGRGRPCRRPATRILPNAHAAARGGAAVSRRAGAASSGAMSSSRRAAAGRRIRRARPPPPAAWAGLTHAGRAPPQHSTPPPPPPASSGPRPALHLWRMQLACPSQPQMRVLFASPTPGRGRRRLGQIGREHPALRRRHHHRRHRRRRDTARRPVPPPAPDPLGGAPPIVGRCGRRGLPGCRAAAAAAGAYRSPPCVLGAKSRLRGRAGGALRAWRVYRPPPAGQKIFTNAL